MRNWEPEVQLIDGRAIYSATDLNNFLECRRLTGLSREVALDLREQPEDDDETRKLIARKGDEHERNYLERQQITYGGNLVAFNGRAPNTFADLQAAEEATIEAMRRGVHLIYQATFFDGQFLGRADFLRRIPGPSNLGEWSYDVIDTKLALSTKAYFLIQICNYSEHLKRIQGVMPEHGYIVLGNGEERRYRLNDYSAYYRHLKASFLEYVEGEPVFAPSELQGFLSQFAAVLLAIHQVDWERLRLSFLPRQKELYAAIVRRETGISDPLRAQARILRSLAPAWPPANQNKPVLLHGDFWPGNVLWKDGRIAAVIDWEDAALGDPLADLGYLLSFWRESGEPQATPLPDDMGAVTSLAGLPSRAEVAARYEQLSGRRVTHLTFYIVLAIWKLAILLEGSYKRFQMGTTDDPFFALLKDGVPALAARAKAIVMSDER